MMNFIILEFHQNLNVIKINKSLLIKLKIGYLPVPAILLPHIKEKDG